MKITTWNCQGALRKKAESVLSLQPDILIVPECERPDRLTFGPHIPPPNDMVWFGSNPRKGLGVFSYSNFGLTTHVEYNPDFKFVVPISISDGPVDFVLFAVWTNNPADPDGTYITQVWKAIHYYDTLLRDQSVILAGDFNSNTIWDRLHRDGNHSEVVQRLSQRNIRSTYHLHYKQTQGKEEHPTLYLQRKYSKAYHIDYCFASGDLTEKLVHVDVGVFEDWISYSDHVPLTTTFRT